MADDSERGQDGGSAGPERTGLFSHRVRVVLLVLLVFGLPTVLMLGFLDSRGASLRPPYADQPGGTIAGMVTAEDGAPAEGAEVQVMLRPRDSDPRRFVTAVTGADGRFSVEVPPLDGCYIAVAGGGTWVEVAREITLATPSPPSCDFTLRPGCEIALTLSRADGRAIDRGDYELRRAARRFGLPFPSAAIFDRFEGTQIERGGLRPGSWALVVMLDDGTEATFELELAPGRLELALPPI